MKTIAFANQKGGPGKTMTSLHFSWFLAEKNFKVLFIDLDGQGNATQSLLGERPFEMENCSANLFLKNGKVKPIKTNNPLLDLLPATYLLHDVDCFTLDNYKFVIEKKAIFTEYDYIIIDTPPCNGLRLTGALAISDKVVAPLECNYFGAVGLTELQNSIDDIKNNGINEQLELSAVVPNKFRKTKKQKTSLEDINNMWPDLVVSPIKLSECIETAVESSQPVWFKPQSSSQRNTAKLTKQSFIEIFCKVTK